MSGYAGRGRRQNLRAAVSARSRFRHRHCRHDVQAVATHAVDGRTADSPGDAGGEPFGASLHRLLVPRFGHSWRATRPVVQHESDDGDADDDGGSAPGGPQHATVQRDTPTIDPPGRAVGAGAMRDPRRDAATPDGARSIPRRTRVPGRPFHLNSNHMRARIRRRLRLASHTDVPDLAHRLHRQGLRVPRRDRRPQHKGG